MCFTMECRKYCAEALLDDNGRDVSSTLLTLLKMVS